MEKNPGSPAAAPASDNTVSAPADTHADRVERQLQRLDALTEMGMTLVRAEAERMLAAAAAATSPSDPVLADFGETFAQLTRDVQRTIALSISIEAQETARKLQAAAREKWPAVSSALRAEIQRRIEARQRAADAAALADWEARRDRIRQGMEATIRTKANTRVAVKLLVALDARLDSMGAETPRDTRPVAIIAAAICKDLGIDPDFSVWSNAELGYTDPAPGGKPQDMAKQPAAAKPVAAQPAEAPDRQRTRREANAAAEERRRRQATRLN